MTATTGRQIAETGCDSDNSQETQGTEDGAIPASKIDKPRMSRALSNAIPMILSGESKGRESTASALFKAENGGVRFTLPEWSEGIQSDRVVKELDQWTEAARKSLKVLYPDLKYESGASTLVPDFATLSLMAWIGGIRDGTDAVATLAHLAATIKILHSVGLSWWYTIVFVNLETKEWRVVPFCSHIVHLADSQSMTPCLNSGDDMSLLPKGAKVGNWSLRSPNPMLKDRDCKLDWTAFQNLCEHLVGLFPGQQGQLRSLVQKTN